MLSEFIQLNAIKSHPNLPRFIPIKTQQAKFSLQFHPNAPFHQPEESQQLIPKKIGKTPLKTQDKQNHKKSSLINSNISNFSGTQKFSYFSPRQPSINNFKSFYQDEKLQGIKNKIPLISSKRQNSLSKEGASLVKRSPLITSSNHKFLRMNPDERLSSEKIGMAESSIFTNSLAHKITMEKSMQQQILCINEKKINKQTNSSKKILLKSASYQNLSPLKQKLYKITNRQNSGTQKFQQGFGKRNLQRSSSFKRIIEQSRQKRKIIDSQKQNISANLNAEYYVGANVKMKGQNKIECRKLVNSIEKVIRNPIKKPNGLLKSNTAGNAEKFNQERKKIDSFVQEHVVNSNMFAANQQNSSILNMDPY